MSGKPKGEEEASPASVWGIAVKAEETVGTKALRQRVLGMLEGQPVAGVAEAA